MELQEAINTRRTVRKYKDSSIPIEDIKKVIDAARIAPSATNSQNWMFIAVTNKEILNKMAKAIEEKFEYMKSITKDEEIIKNLDRYSKHSTFFEKAPVTFVIVETEKKSFLKEVFNQFEYDVATDRKIMPDSSLLSIGGAIENMSLMAHSLGYGTCWMVAPVIAAEELGQILELDENSDIVSLLPMGIPDGEAKAPIKKTLEDIMILLG